MAGRQIFEKFRQLHIDEPGRNWYNSLWRVLQAYQDLPGPTGLSPHHILFLRDRVSRTLPWLNHGKVAQNAIAMMAEADNTAAKVCKALQAGKGPEVCSPRHRVGGAAPQGCPVQTSAGILVCAGGNRAEGQAGCVCGSFWG